MSKYLVKILSICAFVVMLPLIILGTALCVTESANYKVRVFVDGNDGEYATCEVLINGEKRDNNEITLLKNTEVVVSFVETGYDFAGWYEGSNTTYQATNKVVSENNTFSFKLTENVDLTAKCSVKSYKVTYSGTFNDGSELIGGTFKDGTAITEESLVVNYKYGEPLKELAPKGENEADIFTWWIMKDGSDATEYRRANFAKTGEYELVATWSNQKQVNYYAADKTTLVYTQKYERKEFEQSELLTASNTAVKKAVSYGYEFAGWTDENSNDVINLQEYKDNYTTEALNLYMKENLVTYNVNVKYNAVSSDSEAITYDVKAGFSEYTERDERTYYTFIGFRYENKVYTYNSSTKDYTNENVSLGTVLVDNNVREANVTAVWKAEYTNLTIKILASDQTEAYSIYGKANGSNTYNVVSGTIEYDVEDALNCIALETKVKDEVLSEFDTFYINDGGQYKEVKLTGIKYRQNGSNYVDSFTELTFADLIDGLEPNFDKNADIEVRFIFDLV